MSKVTRSTSLKGKPSQTDITIEIQDLMQAADKWQENFLNPCQDALYALLQDCYATYKKIKGKKTSIQDLDLILTNKGVKVQSNSSTAGKLLRVVFNFADRRKVSKYAKVIEWADKKNLAVDKVASTIKSHKGIEAICSSKGKSKASEDFTENAVQQLPKLKKIGTVAKSHVATYKTNELVFFVGVAQSDGSVKLVQTVDLTEAQTKPILSKIGKTLKDTKPENLLKMSSTKESSTQKAAAKAKKAA